MFLRDVGPGGVDKRVDPTGGVGDCVDGLRATFVVAKIESDRPCLTAKVAHGGRELGGGVLVAAEREGDMASPCCELANDRSPESATPPDDERRTRSPGEVVGQVEAVRCNGGQPARSAPAVSHPVRRVAS